MLLLDCSESGTDGLESPIHDRADFDMGMHGLDDLVAGFDESGGNMFSAGGQEGLAVVVNFLSPSSHSQRRSYLGQR
jgi:hypothetical protein